MQSRRLWHEYDVGDQCGTHELDLSVCYPYIDESNVTLVDGRPELLQWRERTLGQHQFASSGVIIQCLAGKLAVPELTCWLVKHQVVSCLAVGLRSGCAIRLECSGQGGAEHHQILNHTH